VTSRPLVDRGPVHPTRCGWSATALAWIAMTTFSCAHAAAGATVLELRTVPPLPGVAFAIEGRIVHTGADGTASVPLERDGVYGVEVLPWNDRDDGARVSFARWGDALFTPLRAVTVAGATTLEAGFVVSRLVSPTFIDVAGRPVPPDRVESMTIRASHGQVHVLDHAEPFLLEANRVVRRLWGLDAPALRYALEAVVIDGCNVVNRGQQRLLVGADGAWEITVLLYDVRIRAVDALSGHLIGDGILIEFPNGRSEVRAFGPEGSVVLTQLARGTYTATVVGAKGVAPGTPVVATRDQDVELKVLSTRTIWTGIGLGVFGALGLLVSGRPHLAGLRQPRRTQSSVAAD
jgi:hypothetical protein